MENNQVLLLKKIAIYNHQLVFTLSVNYSVHWGILWFMRFISIPWESRIVGSTDLDFLDPVCDLYVIKWLYFTILALVKCKIVSLLLI